MSEPRRLNSPALVAVLLAAAMLFAGLLVLPSFWLTSSDEVVVYTALDYDFSAPIFEEFTRRTGIDVRAKYDTESTKTVGLTQALLAEADRPRCDLFWNNEILNTLRLQRAGLLRSYESPAGADYPAMYRDADGQWYGFAARARILLVNTDLLPEADRPKTLAELTEEPWRGRVAMAKPLFGTTATHAACLFAKWGDAPAREFFESLKANDVQVLAGNRQVAAAVAAGQAAVGLTDTDDAMVEIAAGSPVAIVYPDQGDDGLGTLFIPNTLALIKGGPNPENTARLVEFLLSPEVETMLAQGPSAQIPLNPAVEGESQLPRPDSGAASGADAGADAAADGDANPGPGHVRAMQVDFPQAAALWDTTAEFLRQTFGVD